MNTKDKYIMSVIIKENLIENIKNQNDINNTIKIIFINKIFSTNIYISMENSIIVSYVDEINFPNDNRMENVLQYNNIQIRKENEKKTFRFILV